MATADSNSSRPPAQQHRATTLDAAVEVGTNLTIQPPVPDNMHLFSDIKFHDYKRQRVDEMEDEISELSSDELENSTDALALIFAEKYGHSQLQVHEPIREDGGEVEKDVSDDPRRMIIDRSTDL